MAVGLVAHSPGSHQNAPQPAADNLGGLPLRPSQCRLVIGGNKIPPKRFAPGQPVIQHLANGSLTLDGSKLVYVGDHGVVWSRSDAPSGVELLAEDAGTAYLADPRAFPWGYEKSFQPKILRLDLQTGRWLTPIPVSGQKGRQTRLIGLAASQRKLALLKLDSENKEGFSIPTSIDLELLDAKAATSLWTKPVPDPLLALHATDLWPNFWGMPRGSATRTIQWANGNIVVCAHDEAPILSYDPQGALTWRVDRPWEIVKKVIGPSVYSFYLARSNGNPGSVGNPSNDPTPEGKGMQGRILAGPIWVPAAKENLLDPIQKERGRFVIATIAYSTAKGSTGDGVVFELSETGKPITRTAVPQEIRSYGSKVIENGVVLAAANGTLLRLRCFRPAASGLNVPWRIPDLTARIDWLIQQAPLDPVEQIERYSASSATEGDFVEFTNSKAIRACEGWHCLAAKGSPVTFPLQIVDLATGARMSAELAVQLSTAIARPATNYSGSGSNFAANTPLIVDISGLAISGDCLRVSLKGDKGAGYLDFPLPKEFL